MSDFSPVALAVLRRRYLKKNTQGEIVETTDELFERVAAHLSLQEYEDKIRVGHPDEKAAQLAKEFHSRLFGIMADLKFLPNSPCLMNAGNTKGNLSACFVLPVRDTMEDIVEAARAQALVLKFGGGTGFSVSRIRPKSEQISSTHGYACGPVAVLRHLHSVADLVTQGGKRLGANMGILAYNHPDILDFIEAKKSDSETLTNFNISVSVDQAFFDALETDDVIPLVWPTSPEYAKLIGKSQKVYGHINARELWDRLITNAHESGDPGLIYLDRIEADNRTPNIGFFEATNPCGEQPLLPYESCNLGSINLSKFVKKPFECPLPSSFRAHIDWADLESVVRVAIRALDNVISSNDYSFSGGNPLDADENYPTPMGVPAIEYYTKATRKVGLGVMGFAHMLVKLNIAYDSAWAESVAEAVMEFISKIADSESEELALEKGVFPAWYGSVYDFCSQFASRTESDNAGRFFRNATRTTIAPTGSISIIAGTSGGVEPLFALAYQRAHHLEEGDGKTPTLMLDSDPVFEEMARFYNATEEQIDNWRRYLTEKEVSSDGSIKYRALKDLDDVPEAMKQVLVTANDIDAEWHIRIQAAFQKFTCNAVSKTINFPSTATLDDVKHAYQLSRELGCKGITIYRDGSRSNQVLDWVEKKVDSPTVQVLKPISPVTHERPEICTGLTASVPTGLGKLFVTVNRNGEPTPFELFATVGHSGSEVSAFTEGIARLVSLALRRGIPADEVSDQLIGIGGSAPVGFGPNRILSVPDAIGKVLLKASTDMSGSEVAVLQESIKVPRSDADLCPECHQATLYYQEGCTSCPCGFSKC